MQSRSTIVRESPIRRSRAQQRRGTALVLMVVCLIPLIGFLALAIDIGMLAHGANPVDTMPPTQPQWPALGPSMATPLPTTITPP